MWKAVAGKVASVSRQEVTSPDEPQANIPWGAPPAGDLQGHGSQEWVGTQWPRRKQDLLQKARHMADPQAGK